MYRYTVNRPISVYYLGEMPMQSCGHSVSSPRGKAGARLNAHTELRAKRQRSARKAILRNRPIAARGKIIEYHTRGFSQTHRSVSYSMRGPRHVVAELGVREHLLHVLG